MPFQNSGTLLENLTLLEAARLLFNKTEGLMDLASAFSMPPLTLWRRAEKYEAASSLFTIEQLSRVAAESLVDAHSYRAFLQRCLLYDRMRGPNGPLLVGLVAQHENRRVRAWVEDVSGQQSHYGPTRAPLEALGTYVATLGTGMHSPFDQLVVSDTPYPACIEELSDRLDDWDSTASPAARIGYLDPNVYVTPPREGPQTASPDHREWLDTVAQGDPDWAVVVHFSSNRDRKALLNGIRQMHKDAWKSQYHAARSYRHQAHTTTVLVEGPSRSEAIAYANQLDARVQACWDRWCASSTGTTAADRLQTYTAEVE